MLSFTEYYSRGKRGHLIGIGGVSMSPLAEVLSGAGLVIAGSDMAESDNTARLRKLDIDIHIGHAAENIAPDTDFVVRTAAVHNENPEIEEARRRGIPVFERTEAWGAIMCDYKNALCIAGTHGKTTTTSMCTHILMAAQKDPTVMIGGTLPLLRAGHRVGAGDTIIMEACEYYNSFLAFRPTVAVILDIEADHLDYFHDLEDVKTAFRRFAALVPSDGTVIANADDQNTMDTLRPLERELFTFGLSDTADVYAARVVSRGAQMDFDIMFRGRFFTSVSLRVPGMHNVKNALAAAAAAITLDIPPSAVKYGLAGFTAANRRFEFKGKYNGADIYDDYAHHPGELRALLDAVEPLGYKRIIMVFQPHTYTRTQALFEDFLEQLRRPDVCYLAEIYAAREKNTIGISSGDLSREIPNSLFFPDMRELERSLRAVASPGDLILTVGAGDVYRIGERLICG
jgi:UDP-N-acetylmuramate--alanine ligase